MNVSFEGKKHLLSALNLFSNQTFFVSPLHTEENERINKLIREAFSIKTLLVTSLLCPPQQNYFHYVLCKHGEQINEKTICYCVVLHLLSCLLLYNIKKGNVTIAIATDTVKTADRD